MLPLMLQAHERGNINSYIPCHKYPNICYFQGKDEKVSFLEYFIVRPHSFLMQKKHFTFTKLYWISCRIMDDTSAIYTHCIVYS